MEKFNYRVPESAPTPEGKEDFKLDTVVVIPAMDEGLDIIDSLESVATQKKVKGDRSINGVVVVINNRPDAPQSVVESNMKTYTLLQALRHQKKLTIDKDSDLSAKVKTIQESGLTIEVVDAFYDGYAQEEGTVGRARAIGTEHALGLVRDDDSVIVSSDADSQLGPLALFAVRYAFEKEKVDATPLDTHPRAESLDPDSMEAFCNYTLYWRLRNSAFTGPHKIERLKKFTLEQPKQSSIETDAVWMSGAGSAFKAGAYKKSEGYRDIGSAEDTMLAASLSESGATIKNLSDKYPQLMVYTRPRISERTARGFGHTIKKWQHPGKKFSDIEVPVISLSRRMSDFYIELENIQAEKHTNTQVIDIEKKFSSLCEQYGLDEQDIEKCWHFFSAWNGENNAEEHLRLMGELDRSFQESSETVTLGRLMIDVEESNQEFSKEAFNWTAISDEAVVIPFPEWEWNQYRNDMKEIAHLLELQGDQIQKVRAYILNSYTNDFGPVLKKFFLYFTGKVVEKHGTERDKSKLEKIKPPELEEMVRTHLVQQAHSKLALVEFIEKYFSSELSIEQREKMTDLMDKSVEEYRAALYAELDIT